MNAESAREKCTRLVRRLVGERLARVGGKEEAMRSLSRDTGISMSWLKRAGSRGVFAPLMHHYDALLEALEAEIENQKQKLQRDEETLRRLRGENDALIASNGGARTDHARAGGGKGRNRN